MKYCINCLYPDTKPELNFNENGICSACLFARQKDTIDWDSRKKELQKILENYRSNDDTKYDCIIPVSGGKDSTYQAYVIKNDFNLNPLLVSFHPRDFTELGRKNIENIKNLGLDCIEFTANPVIYKKLAKFGLTELGDVAWPEHIGIFTVPIQIAIAYKIPLLIWGENPQFEYGGPASTSLQPYLDREWNEKHGGYFLDKIRPEDMVKHGLETKDLKPYLYPSDEEIRKVGVTGVFLGYFTKWDARKQLEIIKKIGFQTSDELTEGTYTNYENLDTKYVAMHDYFKFLKYGFGRATDHASIDIRNNRLTREEGLSLVKKYEGKIPVNHLKYLLNDFNLTEDEFLQICDKFTNKLLFKTDKNNNLIRDENNNIEKLMCDNT
jgi:N-acetyl sugar amidotransferase